MGNPFVSEKWKVQPRTPSGELIDADAKLGWLTLLGSGLATAFTALNEFNVLEPAGWGRFCYASAALFIALAVALLARGWLRPQTATDAAGAKAFAAKYGAVFGVLALLLAGLTPLASLAYPEVGAGFLGRRLTLGYAGVPGHADSLVVSASGRVDPSASVVIVLSKGEEKGNVAVADARVPLACEDDIIARWGIAPSSQGDVKFEGRTAVPQDAGLALCVRAWRYEHGVETELTRLIIPGIELSRVP